LLPSDVLTERSEGFDVCDVGFTMELGAETEAPRELLVLRLPVALHLPFHLPPVVPDERVALDVVGSLAVKQLAVADAFALLAPGQGEIHDVPQKGRKGVGFL
jgi:hypothetical protein